MADPKKQGVATKARKRALRAGRKLKYRLTTSASTRRAELIGKPERWEAQRRFQFDFLTSHGLAPEHRLLDIGCGTLRVGIPLIEYLDTGHYAGVEARAPVLKEGRRALAEAGWSTSAQTSSMPPIPRRSSSTPRSTSRGRSWC